MNTFKTAVLRGLLGIPLGVFVGTTIGIIIHYTGNYPVMSRGLWLTNYIVAGIVGFAFAAGSAVYEIDRWSMLKQTTLHFILMGVVYFPCAFISGWIPKGFLSALLFVAIYLITYFASWLGIYHSLKLKLKKINEQLAKNQE